MNLRALSLLLLAGFVLSGCCTRSLWARQQDREEPVRYLQAKTDGTSIWLQYTASTYPGSEPLSRSYPRTPLEQDATRWVRYELRSYWHRMDKQFYQMNANWDGDLQEFDAMPVAPAVALPLRFLDLRGLHPDAKPAEFIEKGCNYSCAAGDMQQAAYLFQQLRQQPETFLLVSTYDHPDTGAGTRLILVKPDEKEPHVPVVHGLPPPWRLVSGVREFPLAASIVLTPFAVVADVLLFPVQLIWALWLGDIKG